MQENTTGAPADKVNGGKLSARNLWCYSGGGVGRDMAYKLWDGFLLVFIMYTKNLTPSQFATIAVIMAFCRIWDAINDPIMGGIIERTRTKWGKFKPWIFIGAVTNSAVMFLLFSNNLTGSKFMIFFPIAYLLWDITFTMNDIGYWAMLPSLSSNEHDRNRLSSLTNILHGIGGDLAGIVIPIFTMGALAIGGTAISGFKYMSLVIAACFIGFQTMTCLGVKERRLPTRTAAELKEKKSIKEMFGVVFKNDQLLWIALVMILYNFGSSLYYASMYNFLYFRFGYEGVNASLFSTIGGIIGGISIFYPLLAKKFSRRTISIMSISAAAVAYTAFFALGSTTLHAENQTLVFILMIICSGILIGGQSLFYMVQTVSIANCIEYNEWKTGKREEGIIFSIRPFMAKMGSALVAVTQGLVYAVWKGSNGKSIADITGEGGISSIEQDASYIIAEQGNIITSGVSNPAVDSAQGVFQSFIDRAGMTYHEAEQLILGEAGTANFENVISRLKTISINNILAGVDDGMNIWLLFCFTILPMIFVVLGLIVWVRKFKLDEKKYASIVADIEARRADSADANE